MADSQATKQIAKRYGIREDAGGAIDLSVREHT